MRSLVLSVIIGGSLSIYGIAFAQGAQYTPLVGFPGIDGNTMTAIDYVKALYMLSISVAGILAVVKIIFGGVKYMLSDVVTTKGDAIKDIRGALLGLLIVLGAVLILNTINPNLTTLSIFGGAPAIDPTANTVPVASAPLPNPDTQIGDTLNSNQATAEEVAHFNSTCPGTVNSVYNGSYGAGELSCDSGPDVVAQTQLNCSSPTTCTCDFSATQNRGLCASKCETTVPAGYALKDFANISTTVLQCNYTALATDTSTCQSQAFTSCLTTMIGSDMCDNTSQPVCNQIVNGNMTFFYSFK